MPAPAHAAALAAALAFCGCQAVPVAVPRAEILTAVAPVGTLPPATVTGPSGGGLGRVGEQVPGVGLNAAAVVLVFLGLTVAAWQGYERVAQSAVRAKYRRRVRVALVGMATALASAIFGLVGIGTAHTYPWVDAAGVGFLAAAAGCIAAVSVMAAGEV